MICEICGKEIKNIGYHVKIHNITNKEYYDKYLKSNNDGNCVTCGKPTKFINLKKGYAKHCSCTCTQLDSETQNKIIQTSLFKYGVKHPVQSEIIQNKIKNTNQKKYGVDNVYQSEIIKEKIKKTNLITYGVEHPMQCKEIQEKLKNTIRVNYGVDYVSQSLQAKNANKITDLIKYGNEYHIASNNCIVKSLNTKISKHNISLSEKRLLFMQKELLKSSKDEQNFYSELNKNYTVLYNCSSEKYPYLCDFYIFDLDLYIELNLTWTHGWHYFDETNLDDVNKLQEMKSKHNDYYDNAIDVWTKKDIEKRDCAIKNNLNFVVIWNKDQIKKFLELLESNYTFTRFIDFNQIT